MRKVKTMFHDSALETLVQTADRRRFKKLTFLVSEALEMGFQSVHLSRVLVSSRNVEMLLLCPWKVVRSPWQRHFLSHRMMTCLLLINHSTYALACTYSTSQHWPLQLWPRNCHLQSGLHSVERSSQRKIPSAFWIKSWNGNHVKTVAFTLFTLKPKENIGVAGYQNRSINWNLNTILVLPAQMKLE